MMKDAQHRLSAGDSIFTSVRWPKSKPPRRAAALETIERLIPWGELEKIIRPHYASDTQNGGRPGYSLKMLVRCYILQAFWQLSDCGLENFVIDSHAAARFIGSDPWQPRPPSASRMRDFRRLLENRGIDVEIDAVILEAVYGACLQVRMGHVSDPVFRKRPAA